MTIEQLHCFLAVVDTGSFSEAAERLFTTQSSVSKHIQALEKELNVTLFDRSKRKSRLTEVGELLLEDVRHISDLHQHLIQTAAKYTLESERELRIASIPVMAQYDITGLIADFSNQYPDVRLNIQEVEGVDIAARLKNQEFDFAFMRTEYLDRGFASIPILHDHLAVVLSDQHPLADRAQLSLSDLKAEKFLLLGPTTLLYDVSIQACKAAGFTPNVIYTGTRMDTILGLIGRNQGISLMMDHAVSYVHQPNIRIVPLAEQICSTIGLVRVKNKPISNLGRAFWNSIYSNLE